MTCHVPVTFAYSVSISLLTAIMGTLPLIDWIEFAELTPCGCGSKTGLHMSVLFAFS